MMQISSRPILLVIAILLLSVRCGHGAEPVLDSAMDNDPKLALPGVKYVFSKELKPLWLKALEQPENDLKRQAADAIARAHKLGMKGLKDTTDALRKTFRAENAHLVVRLAVARTLITLDARDSAAMLFQHLDRAGAEYALVVEPALAKWDYMPARKLWLARLSSSQSRRSLLRLAIRSLAEVRESDASKALWKLAGDPGIPAIIRIDAGKALGQIETSGLLDRATKLSNNNSPKHIVNRLVAVSLLARHEGEDTEKLLLKLAVDRQPTVAAMAYQRLMTIDPQKARSIATSLLRRKDSQLRRLGCRSLAGFPEQSSVGPLSSMLSDPHPDIRNFSRKTLVKFAAKPELGSVVIKETMQVIGGGIWQGHEQGSLLLAQLNHKPAAKRLGTLLESKRPEVMVAAAWALRKLAVLELLPVMLRKAQRESANNRPQPSTDPNAFPDALTAEMGRTGLLVQLFQAFGQTKYRPAIPLLRKFVPKTDFYKEETRAAAVWALGFLETGPDANRLATQLAGRLADANSTPPEAERVRWMSAVSLGRLQAKKHLPVLHQFYRNDGPQGGVGLACRWAIREISNETLPGSKTMTRSIVNWFVEPISKP